MTLSSLASDAAHANDWHRRRVLRRYQWEVLLLGSWVAASGAEFRAVASRGRYVLVSAAYPDAALITGEVGSAYEITHVVWRGEVYSLTGENLFPAREADPVRKYGSSLGDEPETQSLGNRRVLRVGHPNFAHFLWNELPALVEHEDLLAGLVERGDLELVLEPHHEEIVDALGGIDRLLPKLGGKFNSRLTWGGSSVPFGSMLITSEVQERVRRSLSGLSRIEVEGPVLWVSVRLPPRSPSNQVEFLIEVVDRWLSSSAGTVIVDGFATSRSFQPHFADRIAETDSLVKAIADGSSKGTRRTRVRTTVGMDLAAVLATAALADYYVSPEGTVQHKLGWVWNKPGAIHIGPRAHRDAAVRWHGLQVEGGVDPLALPREHVVGEDKQVSPDDRDIRYSICSSGAVAEWIVERALHAVATGLSNPMPFS